MRPNTKIKITDPDQTTHKIEVDYVSNDGVIFITVTSETVRYAAQTYRHEVPEEAWAEYLADFARGNDPDAYIID